jgi:hypothetical protein
MAGSSQVKPGHERVNESSVWVGTLGGNQWTVIVAMVAVRVMKMAGDVIIHVIAMRDRIVTAAGAVHMARRMATAAVVGGAAIGVLA